MNTKGTGGEPHHIDDQRRAGAGVVSLLLAIFTAVAASFADWALVGTEPWALVGTEPWALVGTEPWALVGTEPWARGTLIPLAWLCFANYRCR